MELTNLTGKTVLLTGGCGAIGRVVVRVLGEHGATLAVNDILPDEEATRTMREAGIPEDGVAYLQADTTRPEEVDALFERAERITGLSDVVCCHAGITDAHPIEEYPLEGFDSVMGVNLRAPFIVAQAAIRHWIENDVRGHLIFTSSWVQDVPWPEITPYATSKAGLKAMMRGFAREVAPRGIRANAIAPGIVAVGMAKHQWDNEPTYRSRAQKAIPLGRMQPPESVAHAFLFLCSEMASYMTGSVLLVDGGCNLYPMD